MKTNSHIKIEQMGDSVQGVRLLGDPRKTEYEEFRIVFPGGHASVIRCTDGAYWIHAFADHKQAWTPGPWRIDGVLPNEPMNIEGQAFDGSWKYICIAIHGGNPKQREANAKLIAKAPEMAAILLDIIQYAGLSPERAERIERILREAGAL